MTKPKTLRTKTGRVLSTKDVDAIAEEVELKDYDVDAIKARRRGRPLMGAAPADVVPVRIDPELRAAIATRAEADHTTASEIIREALRRFLDVA
jgi:predicted transcriptional regulator